MLMIVSPMFESGTVSTKATTLDGIVICYRATFFFDKQLQEA